MARLLGVLRAAPGGYVLLGANGLGRLVAKALLASGEPVTLVDTDAEACRRAQEEGFQVIYGDGLDERTLLRAQPEGREGFVGLTLNEGVNLLFAQKVRELEHRARPWVALHRGHIGVKKEHTGKYGRVLFGDERNLDVWAARWEKGQGLLERWRLEAPQVEGLDAGGGREAHGRKSCSCRCSWCERARCGPMTTR